MYISVYLCINRYGTHMYLYVCIYMYEPVYVRLCICIYIYVCASIYIYIHIYVHIYMYAHMFIAYDISINIFSYYEHRFFFWVMGI